jgi:hypothetical protein
LTDAKKSCLEDPVKEILKRPKIASVKTAQPEIKNPISAPNSSIDNMICRVGICVVNNNLFSRKASLPDKWLVRNAYAATA